MLSSSGSASVAPRPRSTVRRGICFLVMNMAPPPPPRFSVRFQMGASTPKTGHLFLRGPLWHDETMRRGTLAHRRSATVAASTPTESGARRIWNGVLLTMPSTNVDQR